MTGSSEDTPSHPPPAPPASPVAVLPAEGTYGRAQDTRATGRVISARARRMGIIHAASAAADTPQQGKRSMGQQQVGQAEKEELQQPQQHHGQT